jgi:UrcA family protein
MKNLTTLIAVAGFTALLCANAQADVQSEPPTESVHFAVTDAANPATVVALYQRIDAAAGRVCGARLAPGSLTVSKSWRRCVQGAMRDAVAKINMPAVSVYAAAQGAVVYDSAIARN